VSASKLNPNTYRGEERDGGLLSRNQKPTSAKSPQWRGRIYIKGVGWYWLSGWSQGSENDFFITLSLQELTDEQALKFCKPKPAGSSRPNYPSPPNYQSRPANGAETDSDIPF